MSRFCLDASMFNGKSAVAVSLKCPDICYLPAFLFTNMIFTLPFEASQNIKADRDTEIWEWLDTVAMTGRGNILDSSLPDDKLETEPVRRTRPSSNSLRWKRKVMLAPIQCGSHALRCGLGCKQALT